MSKKTKKKSVNKPKKQVHGKQESAIAFEKAKSMTVGELNVKTEKLNSVNNQAVEHEEKDSNILADYMKTHQHQREKSAKEQAIESNAQKRPYIPEEPILEAEAVEERVETGLPKGSKNQWLYATLVVILAGLFIFAWYKSHEGATSQAQPTTKLEKKVKQFEAKLAAFYLNKADGQLKNQEFSKFADIKKELADYKEAKNYSALKKEVATLNAEIKGIKQVNGYFKSDVLVDGKVIETAVVKPKATLKTPKVSNEKLQALLSCAVTIGEKQQKESKELDEKLAPILQTGIEKASLADLKAVEALYKQTSQATQSSYQATFDNINSRIEELSKGEAQLQSTESSEAAAANESTSDNSATAAVSGSFGNTGAVSQAERAKSRVPYDQAQLADVNNPAWIWADGIKERVLDTCRARSYIKGDDYILERVNIINGNGYYNLFAGDGRYLVSINCKTGYFVGNGAGHSDNLDF
ncbi:MAG: hypothetical protein LBS33_07550 [Streptococcaceae bacterium]|jgi:hypothetical protein|nr:hypothetical protein [Streptococcaceae bacterium]